MADWDEEESAPSFGSSGVSNGFGSGGGRGSRGFGNSNPSDENIPKKGFGRGGFGSNHSDNVDDNTEVGRKGFGRGAFGSVSESTPSTNGFGRGGFGQRDSGVTNGWNEEDSSGEGGGFGGRSSGFGAGRGSGFGGGGGGFSGGDDGEDQGGRGGGFGGKGGGRSSGGGACRKCGEEGHFARECPQGGGGKGGGACYKCGEEGHFARECPQSNGGGGFGGGGKSGGFGGGDEGGSSRGFGGGGEGSGSGCHICGEEGHFARECPQKETKELDPNRPAPVTYIPPAPPETEEELFQSIEQGINFNKYDEIPVEVTGRDSIAPISTFEEANLYETFQRNVARAHYVRPTPVQKHSIPIIMAGRDLMACAQTGSGKTAAFLLPVMTGMMNNGLSGSQFSELQAPQAICVAPTRELANQIYEEARKFSFSTMLKPGICYGGVSVRYQLGKIEKGCHLLVATPGRLMDFVENRKISLKGVKYLILDEADRMLDMGFEPKIRELVGWPDMPDNTERQTLMFSATFPEEIQRLAGDFLNDYLFLTVGRVGGTTSDIEQVIVEVSEFEKREKLAEMLSNSGHDRTLVFVESKRSADFLASWLSQEGFPTTSIHGDRLQKEREEALVDFRTGRCPVLIATNVAARGLDIKNVQHVVNFDLPNEIEEYVHRIGRTGRIGNKGKATSFFQKGRDEKIARGLVKVLSDAYQDVPEWLEECAESAVGTDYGPAGGRFGSRDTRKQYGEGRRRKENGSGNGDSWNVDQFKSDETTAPSVNGTDEWNTGGDDSWD